jgi:hypothetical protein
LDLAATAQWADEGDENGDRKGEADTGNERNDLKRAGVGRMRWFERLVSEQL